MNFIRQIERFQELERLIKQKKTGSPRELAVRLGVSRRQLYRLIEILKDYGVPIKYNRSLETFYYSDSFEMVLHFSIRFLSEKENKKINGGSFMKRFFPCFFMARDNCNLTLVN